MNGKILIVEDDPFTKQFYSFLFDREKYDYIITEDGDKLFEIIETNTISLLILDINLKNTFINNKKTDGIEIANLLKNDEKTKNIPIILVTAYSNKIGNKEYYDKSIADDYLVKPINDFNILLDKVKNLIT